LIGFPNLNENVAYFLASLLIFAKPLIFGTPSHLKKQKLKVIAFLNYVHIIFLGILTMIWIL